MIHILREVQPTNYYFLFIIHMQPKRLGWTAPNILSIDNSKQSKNPGFLRNAGIPHEPSLFLTTIRRYPLMNILAYSEVVQHKSDQL